MTDIIAAENLARKAHKGQYYGDQDYYTGHILKVTQKLTDVVMCCDDEDSEIVATLHDIVEDTDVTLSNLAFIHGFDSRIIDAVDAITKRDNETRKEYIKRCKNNAIAHRVKIADTLANLEASVASCDAWRVKKYSKQLIELYKD